MQTLGAEIELMNQTTERCARSGVTQINRAGMERVLIDIFLNRISTRSPLNSNSKNHHA